MTTYTIQGPSGKSYTIEGPEGATADQLGQAVLASSPEERVAAETAKMRAQYDPTQGMSKPELFAAGLGRGAMSVVRGVGQAIGNILPDKGSAASNLVRLAMHASPVGGLIADAPTYSQAEIDQAKKEDAPILATTPGKVGSIVGTAATVAPAMLIPGANTLGGAALVGGGLGALTTEGGLQDRAVGAVTGAAGGAGGQVVGRAIGNGVAAGYRAVRSAAEPFFEAGQQRIAGRALNTAAGSQAAEVANRLQQAAQPFVGPSQPGMARTTLGELVPGSVPTVGQAAGNAGVASLERAAIATNPEVTTQVANQLAAQNGARVNAISDIAGQGGARDFAAAERAATADQLYGAARSAGINPAALTPEAQANIAAMQARIPPEILSQAKSLAQIQGMPMDNTSSLAGLHYVKMALDDAISAAKSAGNPTRARALTQLQQDFVSGIDRLSPDYAAARNVFADMSRPVNQMDVAQAILDKSVNPLTGTLQPSAYARALSDKTAASATGFPGATLEGTMTNQQNNTLQSVLADVQRANAAQNAGRTVGSDTVQKLAYANMLDQAGVPTFLRNWAPVQVVGNLASRAGDVAYARANRELGNRLAQTMLSPQDAADAMRAAALYDVPNPLLGRLEPYGMMLSTSIPATVALPASR